MKLCQAHACGLAATAADWCSRHAADVRACVRRYKELQRALESSLGGLGARLFSGFPLGDLLRACVAAQHAPSEWNYHRTTLALHLHERRRAQALFRQADAGHAHILDRLARWQDMSAQHAPRPDAATSASASTSTSAQAPTATVDLPGPTPDVLVRVRPHFTAVKAGSGSGSEDNAAGTGTMNKPEGKAVPESKVVPEAKTNSLDADLAECLREWHRESKEAIEHASRDVVAWLSNLVTTFERQTRADERTHGLPFRPIALTHGITPSPEGDVRYSLTQHAPIPVIQSTVGASLRVYVPTFALLESIAHAMTLLHATAEADRARWNRWTRRVGLHSGAGRAHALSAATTLFLLSHCMAELRAQWPGDLANDGFRWCPSADSERVSRILRPTSSASVSVSSLASALGLDSFRTEDTRQRLRRKLATRTLETTPGLAPLSDASLEWFLWTEITSQCGASSESADSKKRTRGDRVRLAHAEWADLDRLWRADPAIAALLPHAVQQVAAFFRELRVGTQSPNVALSALTMHVRAMVQYLWPHRDTEFPPAEESKSCLLEDLGRHMALASAAATTAVTADAKTDAKTDATTESMSERGGVLRMGDRLAGYGAIASWSTHESKTCACTRCVANRTRASTACPPRSDDVKKESSPPASVPALHSPVPSPVRKPERILFRPKRKLAPAPASSSTSSSNSSIHSSHVHVLAQ
jgi:hypothetical protein